MRVQDLLTEFAPPQPTDDELDQQLAQDQEAEEPVAEPAAPAPDADIQTPAQPSAAPVANAQTTTPTTATPVASTQPTAQAAPQVTATPEENSFGSNIKILLNLSQGLRNRDPKKAILDRFLSTVGSYFRDFTASKLRETIDFEKNLAKGNMASMFGANEVVINEFVEYVKQINPNAGGDLEEMAAAFVKTFSQNKNIIRANLAAIAGIELNTKGQIARLDADIEANAQKFATYLGKELSRNVQYCY
jgi:hypothetical protein